MESKSFVGRGGEKLQAALDELAIEVGGIVAGDLGSHVGGFTDCLLQAGARRVYSVDTCYGTLAWKLRQDERVIVMERTNAMHVTLPEPVELITIDVGWTGQAKILPHARGLLAPGGRLLTLVKPQYEATRQERRGGFLRPEALEAVLARVRETIAGLGFVEARWIEGVMGGGRRNPEYFVLLR